MNAALTTNLTQAIQEGLKGGLTKDEVLEVLNRLVAVLENSDDE